MREFSRCVPADGPMSAANGSCVPAHRLERRPSQCCARECRHGVSANGHRESHNGSRVPANGDVGSHASARRVVHGPWRSGNGRVRPEDGPRRSEHGPARSSDEHKRSGDGLRWRGHGASGSTMEKREELERRFCHPFRRESRQRLQRPGDDRVTCAGHGLGTDFAIVQPCPTPPDRHG